VDEQAFSKLTMGTFLLMAVNGLLYHFQTMMAWNLMQFLSPLTHRFVEICRV
jgi:solute carrier family 35 protein E2